METMPKVCAAVLALACVGLPAVAQAQVIAGTSLYVTHDAVSQAQVARYELCADTDCREIGVVRVGSTDTLALTVPAWVPPGRRELTVRAVWAAPLVGTSAPTNVLTVAVVGGPERLRTTPEEAQP
jgi:hypothetical protein